MIEHTQAPYKLLQMLYMAGVNGMHKTRLENQWCLLECEQWEVYRALQWIADEEQSWAECRRKVYFITSKGREVYEDACLNPSLHQLDYHKWMQEALTGMTAKGERSSIDRAALPGHKAPPKRQQQEAGALGMLAKELDMSVSQVTAGLLDRQLKLCASCGKFKKIESYHKNKATADGLHGWCKQCRKNKQGE